MFMKFPRWLHKVGIKEREIWGGALCLRVQHSEISSQEGILRKDLESAPEDVLPLDGHELGHQGGEPQLRTVLNRKDCTCSESWGIVS